MITTIQLRRDTAANFASVNPTLAQGEVGFETDTGIFRIGDGSTAWNSLTLLYVAMSSSAGAPSGTPPDGRLHIDTANDRLYVRIGGAWKYTDLT